MMFYIVAKQCTGLNSVPAKEDFFLACYWFDGNWVYVQGLQVFIEAYSYKWQNINININKYKCKRALLASVHWSAQLWQPRVLFPPFPLWPSAISSARPIGFWSTQILYRLQYHFLWCYNSNLMILNVIKMGIWTVDSTFYLFKLHSYKIS